MLSKIKNLLAPSLESQIKTWDDIEVLENLSKFFPRVSIGTEFVQNQHGFLTHEVLRLICGDNTMSSPPRLLDWPLEPVAYPGEKDKLN